MQHRQLVTLCLLAALSPAALACSAMGPNTHVGEVVAVDSTNKTFTIQDAETQQPISFSASESILLSLAEKQGQVIVRYSGAEGALTAVDVQ
jgi:hypothetical protein